MWHMLIVYCVRLFGLVAWMYTMWAVHCPSALVSLTHLCVSFMLDAWMTTSPLDRSKRFTLFASPGRPVHSNTNSASPGSILARQQLRAKAKSLTFPPLSIARYSFIQLSQQGRQWRERKCPIFETVTKRDSNQGSLDCESGILPLSYRAPHRLRQQQLGL